METAILEQSGELAPDDLKGIRWIDASKFVNRGSDGSLEIKSTEGDLLNTVMPNDVNACIIEFDSASITRIRPMGWKNSTTFFIDSKNVIFTYDYSSGMCDKVLSYPEEATNKSFSEESGNLAYTIGNDVYVSTSSVDSVRVTHHGKGTVSAGVAIHRSEFGIRKGLFWSDDGSKLGFYEMDEAPVSEYPLADYTSVPGTASPIRYPMAGQASHHARVGVFDVESQETVYLEIDGPKDQYLTNFTFSPKADIVYLAVVNRDQDHMKLNTYESESGEFVKTIFEEKHAKYVEPENPPRFMPDGSFIWFSERDGFNHLYHYRESGELIRQVTRGEYDVLQVVSTDKRGRKLTILTTDGLMSRAVRIVDMKSGKTKRLDDREGSFTVYGDDETDLIVKYRSKDNPGEISSYNPSGKQAKLLLKADNPLEKYEIGNIEFPVVAADDGTPLQARLIKPYDFDPKKKYPVLVYVYGGPHAQMVRNDIRGGAPMWMFYAANRGYLVFTID
ncbi:MAG TPA: DPP IV N-terminal domain-containing protein, partial [Cryomorphaceae bacterium]|nr:DPP IV N-terminal domain-containing protein [Cryomorphaceae bacterium]